MSVSQLLSAGAMLWKVANRLYHQYKSPARIIPGPKSSHWIYGNLKEIFKTTPVSGSILQRLEIVYTDTVQGDLMVLEKWVGEYGPTFKYYGVLNVRE